MDYDTFKWSLLEEVKGKTGDGVQVRLHRIPKENGLKTDAITLAAQGGGLTPAMAVRPLYESYASGKETLAGIALRLASKHQLFVRETAEGGGRPPSLEEVSDRIYVRLMNAELNEARLGRLPSVRFLDLAAVFYIRLDLTASFDAMILVNDDDAFRWQVSARELMTLALRNTMRDHKPALIPMRQILSQTEEEEADEEVPVMYVLTNNVRWHGAAAILYPQLLEKVAGKTGRRFFVLPSSVHETIILPDDLGYSTAMLESLVQEVNRTEVRPEDFLSNRVYRYDAESGGLTFACD